MVRLFVDKNTEENTVKEKYQSLEGKLISLNAQKGKIC
jgi:hypothetical protein